MRVWVSKWTAKGTSDIGRLKTTVTVATESVTCAVTLDGHVGRQAAISRAYRVIAATNQWSPDFLRQLAQSK